MREDKLMKMVRKIITLVLLVIAGYVYYLNVSYNPHNSSLVITAKIFRDFAIFMAIWAGMIKGIDWLCSRYGRRSLPAGMAASVVTMLSILIIVESAHLYLLSVEQNEVNQSVESFLSTVSAEKQLRVSPVQDNLSLPGIGMGLLNSAEGLHGADLANKMNRAFSIVDLKYQNNFREMYAESKILMERIGQDFAPSSIITANGQDLAQNDIAEYRRFILAKANLLKAYQNDLSDEVARQVNDNNFMLSYNQNRNEVISMIDTLSDIDNQILNVLENLLILVETNAGSVADVNNDLYFSDPVARQSYASIKYEYSSLVEKENQIYSRIQAKSNSVINQLNQFMK